MITAGLRSSLTALENLNPVVATGKLVISASTMNKTHKTAIIISAVW